MPIKALATEDFSPMSFVEAQKKFGKKLALTHKQFQALETKYKSAAFRVNGIHNARMVQRIRDLLETAIKDGRPFIDLQRQILAELKVKGIPQPALFRIRFAFLENVRQSYADARADTLNDPDITDAFPFRKYKTVGNGKAGVRNVRPEHAALHDKVFRWNDPLWRRGPPFDFGCRCTTIALTAGQVKSRRSVVWTLKGGTIRPLSPKVKRKRFKLGTNPEYARASGEFDLDGLAADLKKLFQ